MNPRVRLHKRPAFRTADRQVATLCSQSLRRRTPHPLDDFGTALRRRFLERWPTMSRHASCARDEDRRIRPLVCSRTRPHRRFRAAVVAHGRDRRIVRGCRANVGKRTAQMVQRSLAGLCQDILTTAARQKQNQKGETSDPPHAHQTSSLVPGSSLARPHRRFRAAVIAHVTATFRLLRHRCRIAAAARERGAKRGNGADDGAAEPNADAIVRKALTAAGWASVVGSRQTSIFRDNGPTELEVEADRHD